MTSAPLAVEEFHLLESERRDANRIAVSVPTVLSPLELAQGKIAKDFVDKWHTAAADASEDSFSRYVYKGGRLLD